MRALDRRYLLLGDWSWLVRDPLDLLRLAFFAGTVAFAVMGRSTAVGLTAASVLLLVARIVNLPRRFDLGLIVAMTFIAWGTALSLYGEYAFYDTIVHAVTPALYAPVLYVCLVRLGVLTDPADTATVAQHVGVFISTLAIGMAVGAGYEVVEWLSDSLLGTAFVENADDTGRDLLADTLGSAAGATLVTIWSIRSWTTHRVTYRAASPPDLRHLVHRRRAVADQGSAELALRASRASALTVAVAGLAALAFGGLVAGWPRLTAETLAIIFGVYAIGHGLLKLATAVIRRGTVTMPLVLDALPGIGIGVVVLAWPQLSATAVFYLIAVTMLVSGLAGAAAASVFPLDIREKALLGGASVASVVLGIVVLAWPRHTVEALRWVVAAQAFVLGVVLLGFAVRMRAGRASAREREVDDEREVVGADVRPVPVPGDGHAARDEAVVQRDAQD